MPSPLDTSLNVGYVEAEDVYIVFTEYYGDGTIYGRRELSLPEGAPIKGSGKTVADLIALGALVADDCFGAVNGVLVGIPVTAEAPAEAPAEVPVSKAPFVVRIEVAGVVITYENVKKVDVKTGDETLLSAF
jgi:hypothetical protein